MSHTCPTSKWDREIIVNKQVAAIFWPVPRKFEKNISRDTTEQKVIGEDDVHCAPPSGSEPLTGRLPWAAAEAGWDRSRPGCMHAGRVRSRLNLPAERVTLIVKERFKSASSYACYSQRYRDQGMLQISSDENGEIDAIGEKNAIDEA